jgi:hypothetical protein
VRRWFASRIVRLAALLMIACASVTPALAQESEVTDAPVDHRLTGALLFRNGMDIYRW